MLSRILHFSLYHRWVILLGAVLLSTGGLYLARTIQVDVFPDLSAPTVTVLTEAHGLDAVEVEKLVTFPLETALNGAPSVRRIRSSSATGISIVWIEFAWGTDIYRARQLVSERLPSVQEMLPTGVSSPTMAPISSIMGEVMLLGVSSDQLSPMEVRTLADWTLRPRLKGVSGVANVVVMGGEYKQIQVRVHPDKLAYYGLSITQVWERVGESNLNVSGGILNAYGNEYLIKGNGRTYTLAELESALVGGSPGHPIYLRDVATVAPGPADKIGDGSLNARPAVIITLSKQPDVNTLELTERIEATLAELEGSLPASVQLHTKIFRQADFIESSIANLRQTLLEGAFFVVLVLIIFLLNWRTTLISLLAIPLSLLTSVIVLHYLGYTLNTMSLGGMAIAIGALVDDAIIDVENVYKRLRENVALPAAQRQPILAVVQCASLEIRSSIIVATLIIIVAFVPLFFLQGMEGRLLAPLGIAFITSVLTSLMVAITLTPVLCSYLLGNEKRLQAQAKGTRIERSLQRMYGAILHPLLSRYRWVVGAMVLLFAGAVVLFTQLGRSFLPEFNEGSLVISAVGVPGMSLEESNRLGRQIENRLLELPEVHTVTRRTGRAELDEHAQGVHASELDVPFVLDGKSKDQFFAEVREKLSGVPGMNITLGQPISHRIDHMLSGTRSNVAVKLFGPELSELFRLGKAIEAELSAIPGMVDVAVEPLREVPQIRITPNRTLLAAYGLTAADLMHQVEIGLGGQKAGELYDGPRYFDVVVRYSEAVRQSPEALRQVIIALPGGGNLPLGRLATVASVGTPHTINREDVERKLIVAANVQGRDLRGAVEEAQQRLAENLALPEGYHIAYGGQYESQLRSSKLLGTTAILATLVIFLLLYLEFRSFTLAGVVLLNLPLALMGGVTILYFTSGILDIAAIIGFISLLGIATRNGILLVSRYEDLRQEGLSGQNLLVQGALDRLNPILMTTITTGLALIPLALKGGEAGNEIQSPMAVVILGGLLSATVLNLLVIPCVYRWVRR